MEMPNSDIVILSNLKKSLGLEQSQTPKFHEIKLHPVLL